MSMCVRTHVRFEIHDRRFEIRDSRREIRDSAFEIRDGRFEIHLSVQNYFYFWEFQEDTSYSP